jgi:hypothetical protein
MSRGTIQERLAFVVAGALGGRALEKALKGRGRELLAVRLHSFAQQQIAQSAIGDGERKSIAKICLAYELDWPMKRRGRSGGASVWDLPRSPYSLRALAAASA